MRRSIRTCTAVAGAALAALSAIAAPAHSAPGADAIIQETIFRFAGTGADGATATCPAGRRIVGGGVGSIDGTGGSIVVASGPVDETGETVNTVDGDVARGWYAKVVNNDGAPRSFKVYALCSATSDATVEETSFNMGAGTSGGASATCAAGRRVTGGGVGTTETALAGTVQASGPVDESGLARNTTDGDVARSWQANVSNSSSPRTYTVFALCSATSDATIEETRFDLATGSSGGAYATCPAGRWVTGGGVGTTADTVDGSVVVSVPVGESGLILFTDDGDLANYWYANVDNLSTPRGYSVAALCTGGARPARTPPILTPPLRASGGTCVVPRLRGKRLATATRAIRRAHCRVGRIRRGYSRRVRKGRVISQTPRPRTTRRVGAKIRLLLSRGPRRSN
jgi:hypothetical protein